MLVGSHIFMHTRCIIAALSQVADLFLTDQPCASVAACCYHQRLTRCIKAESSLRPHSSPYDGHVQFGVRTLVLYFAEQSPVSFFLTSNETGGFVKLRRSSSQ